VEDALGALVEDYEGRDNWLLAGGGYLSLDTEGDGPDNDVVTGFSVESPPGDEAFWQGIISVLQKTTSMLYWSVAVIGQEATLAELPPNVAEGLGPPHLVSTPAEIFELLRNS
jgi:hypothetical protein